MRTVLITGSTSGIGLGMARAFAALHYNIVFNGLEADGAAIAQSVAEAHGIAHHFSPADISNPAAIRDLVQEALERFGSIDILVNNAGIQHVSPIDSFPEAQWDRILAINLSAAFHLSKAVWLGMKEKG